MKTAVILFNLGGPDSTDSIRPFLMNFFLDKNIIRLPFPFRWVIAKLISVRRSKGDALKAYGFLGGKSPLLENTKAQAAALEKNLNEKGGNGFFKVFPCMRYWHPMAEEVTRQVQAWEPDGITLLPLYPQYSTTTTKSSFASWEEACLDAGLTLPTRKIIHYHTEEGFVGAAAENIADVYVRAKKETRQNPRLLFSAHGLPESIIKGGDPYQRQCEESALAIAKKTGIENPDWQICYQSRVGPKKWIGPSIEDALRKAAADRVPVVVYPLSFTQEHVETLVELDIEYKELARKIGLPAFYRVPAVSVHPAFISGLAGMVLGLNKT